MAPQAATLSRESDLPRVDPIKLNNPSIRSPGVFDLSIVAVAVLLAVAAFLVGYRSVADLLAILAGTACLIVVARLLRYAFHTWPGLRSIVRPRVAVLGDGRLADSVAAGLGRREKGALLGIFRPRDSVERGLEDTELLRAVAEGDVDRVAVVLPPEEMSAADRIVHRLSAMAVDIAVYDGADAAAAGAGRAPTPQRFVRRPLDGWQMVAKDVEDRVIGSLLLVLFLPLLAVVAVAVKLSSPGPVFFKQKRHGFRSQEILVYKFRSMRVDAADYSGRNQTQRNDPRVTKVGRFLRATSLDELPQLLNVVRGEMSLVGPRPHPIDMRTNGQLCQEIVENYDSRHRVRPGITGWAQINGYRGATTTREQVEGRVRLDNHYIDNWSLMFDLRIMLLTSVRLFADDNAF
jgi:exopolysaccharide biosynthesis polyprenyl glycosylphosphotransferase